MLNSPRDGAALIAEEVNDAVLTHGRAGLAVWAR